MSGMLQGQLPKHLQKKKDEIDALLAAESANNGKTTPQNNQLPQEQIPQAKPEEGGGQQQVQSGEENHDAEYWKKKYETVQHSHDVLKGKYNKEVRALQEDVNLLNNLKHTVRTLESQMGEVKTENARLTQLLESQPKKEEVKLPDSVMNLLSEKDRQLLDEDGFSEQSMQALGNLVTKLISITAPQQQNDNSVRSDIQGLNSKVESLVKTERQRFEDLLGQEHNVPDWRDINKSPEFHTWLDNPVSELLSITRREVIQQADIDMDLSKVVRMFNEFKATLPKKPGNPVPKINPEDHIEPDRSSGNKQPEDFEPKQKTYSLKEFQKFTREVALQHWKGREAEANKIMNEYLAANAKGLIVDDLNT